MMQTSNLNSPLGASGVHPSTQPREQAGSDILDSEVEKIQLDKSNILLLGPTGSGTKILHRLQEFVIIELTCRALSIQGKEGGKGISLLIHCLDLHGFR